MTARALLAGALLITSWVSSAALAATSEAELVGAAQDCSQAINGLQGARGALTAEMEKKLANFGWSRRAEQDPAFHSYVYSKPGVPNTTIRLQKNGRSYACTVSTDDIDLEVLRTAMVAIARNNQHTAVDIRGNSYIFDRPGSYIQVDFGQSDNGKIWSNVFVQLQPPSTLDL